MATKKSTKTTSGQHSENNGNSGPARRVNTIKMQTVKRGLIHFPPRIFGSKQK